MNRLVGLLTILLPSLSPAGAVDFLEGCVSPTTDQEKKAAVENGLLPRVRFVGEPDGGSPVSERMAALNTPAISFALIDDGRVDWTGAYGSKTTSGDGPVSCETLFQAASLSKPLTLLAALRMKQAGKIDFDADIQRYLSNYKLPVGEHRSDLPITVRSVLEHTSGLTAGGFLGYPRGSELPSDLDVLNGSGLANSPKVEVVQAPGEALAYSGLAYTILEVALQDVTGDSFTQLMEEWILGPLAMRRSEFTQPFPADRIDEVAPGHSSDGKPVEGGWNNYPEQAAAGLWSTAGDLAKFMVEIYKAYHGQSEVLDQDEVRELLHDQRDGHAYGFRISGEELAAPTITHYGGNVGYRSFMFINLETGDGAVYLSNSDAGGNLGTELLYSASKVYDWASYQQLETTRSPRKAEDLVSLVGRYAFNENLEVVVDYNASEGAIGVNFPNGDRYSLVPTSQEDDFIHPGSGVTVSFGLDGEVQTLELYGGVARKAD